MGVNSLLYYCKNLKILGNLRMLSFYQCVLGYLVLLNLVFVVIDGYMIGHNPHHRLEVLDSQGRYEAEWVIDFDAKRITVNLTVFTKGMIEFGISKNGWRSGTGIDVVVGGVAPNGRPYFSDRYSVGNDSLGLDSIQNWSLNEAWESATHTFLSLTRALDTCDPEDYPIAGDKVTLVWAYGETDTEVGYHPQQRGSYDAYLLDPDFSPKIIRDAVQGTPKVIGRENLELKLWSIAKKTEIPENETSYLCTIHKGPRLQEKHHLLGFDVQLKSEDSDKYIKSVHIYKCNAPPGIHGKSFFEPYLRSSSQSCLDLQNPEGEMPTNFCSERWLDVWVPGGKTYFSPNDIGYPFGLTQDEYWLVQTNYHNSERKSRVVEYEVEMYYTGLVRNNEAGILQVGHFVPGITPSLLIPPDSHGHLIFGHCGSECTKLMFPQSGIKIFAVSLHARSSGRKVQLQHFRNSRELPWILTDENFSSDFQRIRNLREHIRVLPGDHLIMKCEYDNTWTNGTIVGGTLANQEVCFANIHYYNKIEISDCKSEIISDDYRKRFLGITNVTWDYSRQEFVVDAPGRHGGLSVSQVSNRHVLWEPEMRAEFERFHRYHPQINKCRVNSQDEYSGATTFPSHAKEFLPERSCSLGSGF